MRIPDQTLSGVMPAEGRFGHRHFWSRAVSRRQFLGTTAAATGAAATAPLWMPALAQAAEFSSVDPKPIPETLFGAATPFHIQLPGPDTELSAISDFNGVLGVAAVSGTGTGTNTDTGTSNPLVFDADMRFMQGQYIGMDGQNHEGTFVFV
jgi:hypothetical protein